MFQLTFVLRFFSTIFQFLKPWESSAATDAYATSIAAFDAKFVAIHNLNIRSRRKDVDVCPPIGKWVRIAVMI